MRPRLRGGGTAGSWFSLDLQLVSYVCVAAIRSDSTYDCLGGWAAGRGPDGMLGSPSIGAVRSASTWLWMRAACSIRTLQNEAQSGWGSEGCTELSHLNVPARVEESCRDGWGE